MDEALAAQENEGAYDETAFLRQLEQQERGMAQQPQQQQPVEEIEVIAPKPMARKTQKQDTNSVGGLSKFFFLFVFKFFFSTNFYFQNLNISLLSCVLLVLACWPLEPF